MYLIPSVGTAPFAGRIPSLLRLRRRRVEPPREVEVGGVGDEADPPGGRAVVPRLREGEVGDAVGAEHEHRRELEVRRERLRSKIDRLQWSPRGM